MRIFKIMDADKFWKKVDSYLTDSLNQAWLCRKVGIPESTLSSAIKRKAWPRADIATKIADVLGVNLRTLITGEESMEEDSITSDSPNFRQSVVGESKELEEPTILVPLAPQKISAGRGEEYLPPSEYSGYVRILERMARGIDPLSLMAVTVKGDSMTGVQIFEGDVVIFARDHISENGIYIISLYGDLKVKRLEFRSGEQQIFIHSENSRYTMEAISMDSENLQILGKVVGWIHCHPY